MPLLPFFCWSLSYGDEINIPSINLKTWGVVMANENEVIVFDNLVRPDREVTGNVMPVKTVKHNAEPFVNTNAAGKLRSFESLEGIGVTAKVSGEGVRALFA